MMARKRKALKKERENGARTKKAHWHDDISSETKKSVLAVILFALALITILSYIGKAGLVGEYVFGGLEALLGRGYFLGTAALLLLAFSFLTSLRDRFYLSTILGGLLFLFVSLGIVSLIFSERTGGYIGFLLSAPFLKIFDFWASLVILAALDVAAVLIMFNIPLWAKQEESDDHGDSNYETEEEMEVNIAGVSDEPPAKNHSMLKSAPTVTEVQRLAEAKEEFTIEKRTPKFAYKRPPLELLADDRGTPSSGDIKANANIIQRTLENFGIHVEMATVSVGPTITQYAFRPAEGVKISRILGLQNDLALALAAHPIRVEAPIPGKSLVGVEVPNRSIALVGLRTLLSDKQFQGSSAPLLFAVGRDVTGAATYADLAKMPHLLIAGATGAGKSVGMHVITTSFLYRNPPEVLRFIMVDPKRVELSIYNGIPHLLTPVITDPKKTIHALRWAVREMERRYELLADFKARDITGFNVAVAGRKDEEPLPYIVIIIDELADLMMAFPREVEGSVVRLAQMARAVGIHLILTTQRPSVEIITGLIKANITSRVAFQTGSQIDSRTIIDMAGAEKLLGNGDMLFLQGDAAKPRRLQGAFVSEGEVKKVVEFLRREEEVPYYTTDITDPKASLASGGIFDSVEESEDELYEEAKQVVIESGKASASLLQRRLRVGYARAARLLDLLEENGIIGPGSGAKPREILVPTSTAPTAGFESEEEIDSIR